MTEAKKSIRGEVLLYTDGSCLGNPGPGGWAFILVHPPTGKSLERCGGAQLTTNNRMELRAVIEGLSTLKRPTSVEIISDSAYVLGGLSSWMASWKKNGWKRRENGKLAEVKNVDLWQALDRLAEQHHLVFTKVKGHSGHPENERCDELAVAESKKIQAEMG